MERSDGYRAYRVTFHLSQEERKKAALLLRRANRDRKAMYQRYGVDGYKPMTLPEWLMMYGREGLMEESK